MCRISPSKFPLSEPLFFSLCQQRLDISDTNMVAEKILGVFIHGPRKVGFGFSPCPPLVFFGSERIVLIFLFVRKFPLIILNRILCFIFAEVRTFFWKSGGGGMGEIGNIVSLISTTRRFSVA
jgi:hypothetical protein